MGKGKAITGLVLGIVAIVACWFGIASLIALPVAIVGLCLSVSGGKAMKANGLSAGLATAGTVIGIIAVILTAIMFFTCGLCALCVCLSGEALDAAAGAVAGL